MVAKKGKARPGRQPKDARVCRSVVYPSRLAALENMLCFRRSLVRGKTKATDKAPDAPDAPRPF